MFHVLAGLYQSTMKSSVTILVLSFVGHPTYIVRNSALHCRLAVIEVSFQP